MMQKPAKAPCSEGNVDHTILKGSLADDKCVFPCVVIMKLTAGQSLCWCMLAQFHHFRWSWSKATAEENLAKLPIFRAAWCTTGLRAASKEMLSNLREALNTHISHTETTGLFILKVKQTLKCLSGKEPECSASCGAAL